MKNLLIAILCLLFLIVPWELYDRYSTAAVKEYCTIIEEEILPATVNNDWDTATTSFQSIKKDWEKFKKISEYFINAQIINEADRLVSKTEYFIYTKDMSNAAAISSELKQTLVYLHENEMLSIGNVL